jgi:ABC-2 type transport system ATP-binding protein
VNSALLELRGVRAAYDSVTVLHGVDLSVAAGQVVALLGPNGAGKTTVVRILSTILGPDTGHASVLGLDVVTQADAVRRTIGLAGQYAAVDENLTGRENIHMVARLSHLSRKVAARRADELLEEFGLSNAGDRVLKTYSGGMRRRLDLAAALVANPPVLFLDEPTTGLDPQSRQGLWASIEELVSEGTTVLLTTQYLEEADRLARDIVVIDHGRVIAEGTPAQLKADLGTSVVSVTLGERAAVERALQLLEPLSEKPPIVEDLVIELTVTDGPKAGAAVLRSLDAAEITIAGLALREPSLDDVFLTLTGHKTTIEEGEEESVKPKRGFRGRKADATDGKDAA